MKAASPPIDGYGELARRALAHSEWPADTQPQWRSLAALFSKLDRQIELEWLADRGAVQRTLGLLLGCPLEVIQRPLQVTSEATPGGRLRFEDVPFARPLALAEEALPPGIPAEVQRPSLWGRVWWRAAAGSGRSITGQWLAARELAVYLSGRTFADVAARIPGHGPVFIELERSDELPALEQALVGREAVCVAAPAPPRRPASAASHAEWRLVESPTPADMLTPLLEWLEKRLPQDGAFEARAAAAWLAQPSSDGTLPTFGALLGAAGLLDAKGLRHAAGKNVIDLATEFVNERLEEASLTGSAEAQWLKRFGFEALVKLAQAVLTGRDERWDIARSQDEWIALIPAEFQQSIDTDWVHWSLARSGGQTTVRDLERALRNVPPGAYRIVRALVEARLLRARDPQGSLVVCPEFLKHAALVRARDQLVGEASAFGWGEALLHAESAPNILESLYRRLEADDFSLVEGLLDLDLGAQPALVVALEAVFVCLGLRVLGGAEVPSEYLEGVWNEQLGWLLSLPGQLPRPRLLCFDSPAGFCALADPAVWGLAALALSEALGERQGKPHPILRPWTAEQLPAELDGLLDAIHGVVLRPEVADRPWAVEAFALAGRLHATRERDHAPAPALSRPARAVRALLEGEDRASLLREVGDQPIELDALAAHCELRGVAWSRMARAIWKSWQAQGCPADRDGLLGPVAPARERFWPHLPPEVLDAAWPRWLESGGAWPFFAFGPVQWSAFIGNWSRHWLTRGDSSVYHAAFEVMDLDSMRRAVTEGQLLNAPEAECLPLLAILWRRFPSALLELLAERQKSADSPAVSRLLRSAPASAATEIVRTLAEGLSPRSTERAMLDEARQWLSSRVSARGADWRPAYALLVELEARVARAVRARGGARSVPEQQ